MKTFSPSSVGFSVVNRKINMWHFLPVAHKWSLGVSFCPAHSFPKRYGQQLPAWLCDSNYSSLCIPSLLWSPAESSQAIILPVIFIHCIIFVFHSEAYFCNLYGYSVTCFNYTPYLAIRSAVFSDVCVDFFFTFKFLKIVKCI